MQPTSPNALAHVSDGLFAPPPAPLPFGPKLQVRAFLIQRADGNLIVCNDPGLTFAATEIARLGGAVRQFINHSHEAMFGLQAIEAPLFVHERDQPEKARSMPAAGAFAERQMMIDDFELVPVPGHTGRHRVPLGQRRPPLLLHRRYAVDGARPMVHGCARLERSHRVHREPGLDARAGLRRPRTVGVRRRRAVRRIHE